VGEKAMDGKFWNYRTFLVFTKGITIADAGRSAWGSSWVDLVIIPT
jgi:hypothetical protein